MRFSHKISSIRVWRISVHCTLVEETTPHPQSLSPLKGEGSRCGHIFKYPNVSIDCTDVFCSGNEAYKCLCMSIPFKWSNASPSPLNGERAGVRGGNVATAQNLN